MNPDVLLCGCTIERPCYEYARLPRPVPVQPLVCACREEDRAGDGCEGEFYSCDGCGGAFDSPLPWYERYGVSDFFYCEPCGAKWFSDGADVVCVVAR